MNVPAGEWGELVLLEEIIEALSQKLSYDANMVPMVESFQVMYAISVVIMVKMLIDP